MADRQQRSNKEAKKQKKDAGGSAPKPLTPIAPPPVTAIIERGKKKNKA